MSDALKGASPRTILLKDYTVPDHLVKSVDLTFELTTEFTRVTSELSIVRNPESKIDNASLQLHGTDLELESLSIDSHPLSSSEFSTEGETLSIKQTPEAFMLQVITIIYPDKNTALEGLFMSHGMYCTQCEAEGFRRISYYPDRPDVLAKFTTTIIADKTAFPVLLSNGNPVEKGNMDNNKHWVKWQDPHPKPSYLFALVAGDLVEISDQFTTCSGRKVDLHIYVEPSNADKCDHAMKSLQQSMKWDEDTFGLEYDLDIYMIVAVDHFNMGAMENKGLNIFNSKFVLARPDTATDIDYINIQAVIGHEYFHNWTGNRVTCRDWFQLSLKEGLTVFRDQEFTSDLNSRAVKRIGDVRMLRSAQFAEDSGPMAHPIRPESYIEINNFYTLTVYEKGAEVIRMIHTLLGRENFRKGLDLYFERHDGQAVTTEDFVSAMQDASGIDLEHFKEWYGQAGTPELSVSEQFDKSSETYSLTINQHTPETPGQKDKKPLHIPVSIALLDPRGNEIPLQINGENCNCTSDILHLHKESETFNFTGLKEKPVASLLRNFSAPVKLKMDISDEELAFLMSHDNDHFNRWDAGQRLAENILQALIQDQQQGKELHLADHFIQAYRKTLIDTKTDPELLAEALTLPGETWLGQNMDIIDVDAIHIARDFVRKQLSKHLADEWLLAYERNKITTGYEFNADAIAKRRLANLCLNYLVESGDTDSLDLCKQHYSNADNMTDAISALQTLVHFQGSHREEFLSDFYDKWQHDNLVIDKWFTLQATSPLEDTGEKVLALLEHPAFDIATPNRVRSLIGAFSHGNIVRFHDASGSGYQFLADQVLRLNDLNPQVASRMLGALSRWKRYDKKRQGLMKAQLERVIAHPSLSKDVYEIASKSLNG